MTQLIVEADGGSRGNPGPAAFGALVRTAGSGDVLAEVGETIGVATNNVAEYRGLIAGLRMAVAIDPAADVEARLDSKLVVEQMSGRWKIKHADMRQLALEAQRIFPPGQVTYTWVPRAENTHADRLLNDALDGKPTAAPGAAGPAAPQDNPGEAKPQGEQSARSGNPLGAWAPEIGPPTTLLLVRHGETPMTKAHVFSGGSVAGPPLDDAGRRQAKRASQFLAGSEFLTMAVPDDIPRGTSVGEPAPVVVASPMVRTRETAEIIAAQLGVAEVAVDEQWRECEFGDWEGMTFTEIGQRYPDELRQWFTTPSFQVPGGESLEELTARLTKALDRTVAQYAGRSVVVATHSMPIRVMVNRVLGAPMSGVFRLQPAPGSVTEIQVYGDGTTALAGFNHRP